MSLRESKQPRKKEPTKEEHILTEQEPDTATKIAEGSVLECLDQIRDDGDDPVHQIRDDDDDPVLMNVAEVLEEKRPKLSRQEWYSLLQTVRHDCRNRQKDLTRILNEIAIRAAASPHTEQGIIDSIILQQYNILLDIYYNFFFFFLGRFCKMSQCLCINSVLVVMFLVLAFLGNKNLMELRY